MKKFYALIVALFIFSISSKAEQTVGTFENAYFGKDFTVEASQKNNELETVYIEVEAKSSKSAFLSVDGNKLESFKTSLELVRDKYLSWVKIAKENNVTEMDKEFDIKFPTVSIAWRGSKWWFAFDRKITMSFLILDNGKMVAIWCPKVSASSNEFIDETIYFVFECEEDFNSLLNQLNSQAILDKLLNTKNNEDLFQ